MRQGLCPRQPCRQHSTSLLLWKEAFEGFTELKMTPYFPSSRQLSFTTPLLSFSTSRKKCYLHLFEIMIFLPPSLCPPHNSLCSPGQPRFGMMPQPPQARVDQSRGGSAGAGRGAGSSEIIRASLFRWKSSFRWKIIRASTRFYGTSLSVREMYLRIPIKSLCATDLPKSSAVALHFVSCLHGLQTPQPQLWR